MDVQSETLADLIQSQREILAKLESFEKGHGHRGNAYGAVTDGRELVNVRTILDRPSEKKRASPRRSIVQPSLIRRLTRLPSLTRVASMSRVSTGASSPSGANPKKRVSVLQKMGFSPRPTRGAHDCSINQFGEETDGAEGVGQGKKNFQRLVMKQAMKGKVLKAFDMKKGMAPTHVNEEQQQIDHAKKVTCHVRDHSDDTGNGKSDKRLEYFDEEEDVWKGVKLIMNPEGVLRRVWDMVIIFLIIFDILYIPGIIGFAKFEDIVNSWQITDIVLDCFFVLDIFLNFRTGYRRRNGVMVTSPIWIAKRYAKRLLVPDIVASVPFGLVHLLGGGLRQFSGPAYGLLKMPRLLRIARVAKYLERSTYATSWRLFRLCWLVFIIAHWLACGWMYIMTMQGSEPTDWTLDGLKTPIDPHNFWENYSYCLHTAMLLLLGDNVYPTTQIERGYCTVALFIGACVVATIMGNVSLLIQNQNSLSAKFKSKMDTVNESMRALNFPLDMMKRVQQYYDYLWQKNRTLGDDWVNQDLSVTLRTEVEVFLNRALLSKCTLFHRCSVNALLMIVDRLSTEVFLPGDNIIRDGDIGSEMYFLVKGKAKVVKFKEHIAELNPGQYFGERSLMNQADRRTCDVQAITYCDLRVLPKTQFIQVASVYPELRSLLESDNETAFARASNVASHRKTIAGSNLASTLLNKMKEGTSSRKDANEAVLSPAGSLRMDLKIEAIDEISGSSGSQNSEEDAGDVRAAEKTPTVRAAQL